jgi:hypothetical protein
MTIDDDCPSNSNSAPVAGFVDQAQVDRLTESRASRHARLARDWKRDKQPQAEAANAERLFAHNRGTLRKAGAAIDAHRAGDGKEAYNEKKRDAYAEGIGSAPREYVTGLTDEEKKARRRERDRERKRAARRLMTQADRDAEAAKKREQRELEAFARDAMRKIF